jgi:ribonuclease BN (tRNA processing enzyme)
MPRVTFLGVGAALPAPGQTNCAYLIDLPGAVLLFDCGPAILQQLAAVGRSPDEITHLFVSHGHGDHALGWPMLALGWALSKSGKPPPQLLTSAPTWNHLQGLFLHSYSDVPGGFPRPVELATNASTRHALVPGVALTTYPMVHSAVFPVLGLRLETEGKVLAFTADTARSPNVVKLARLADLLVHDSRHAATVEPELPIQHKFHTTARDSGEYAEQAQAQRLALVHIGPEYVGREAKLVAEAKSAFSGKVFAPQGGEVIEV